MVSDSHRVQLLLAMLLLLGGYIDGLSCPSGEHQYSCFSCVSFVTDVSLNYTGARETCRNRKSDLVSVQDKRQAEMIRRYLESLNESRSVWIGQYYRYSTACYTASSNAGNWTEMPCTSQRPFICARTYGPASQLAACAGDQVLVVNAQPLKLNVDISGVFVYQLEWMHNSSAVGNAAVARTNDTASLIIQSVNVSTDLGWYTLIVRDPATTYVLAAWLVKQARIGTFVTQPKSLSFSTGDLAVFECLPDPITTLPSASVVWFKNKAPLSPDSRIYVSNFTGTLAIMNVTTADAGVYFCKASNIAGTITSQNATLLVTNQSSSLVQSTFLVQPRNTVVLSGDPFALECAPPLVKSSRTIIFTSDNAVFAVLSDNAFPTYIVQSASLADSNTYSCVQWILPNPLRYSSNATVQVETVAQVNMIVVKLNETVVLDANMACVPRHAPMQLKCSYTSIPPPTLVAWLLNGKKVTTGVVTSTSQVVLDVAYFDTPGVYQCLVSNIHGHSLASVSICSDEDIDTLPGNLNFSVLSDSQTQLFVQWTPSTATPTTDPLLILYEVVFAAHGSPLQFSGMLESYRREYQIKDLKPGTSYNVTVLAHSVWATSNGVWSLASTYGNVPVRAISGLSIIFIGDTSVQVSWEKLETTPPEQPISSYLLSYSDNQSTNASVTVTLGHLVSTYIIKNISATAQFQVCVSYTVQIQRSPALFKSNPSATCVNMTDSLATIAAVVPRHSTESSVNGALLAIVTIVVVVMVIGVLVTVVLVAVIYQKKNGGRYSPARVEKSKEINPDRQRPMGQQVFDLAPTLSMLDEAFNSLSATMDMGIVVSPKPTDLAVQPQPNRIALTPTKDEEML